MSTTIAALGILAAGWQLYLHNQQARYDRRVAYDGVVVSWYPVEASYRPDADGNAQGHFEITVANPGRLPIDRVEVRWVLPCKARPVYSSKTIDDPVTELVMVTSVLAGGSSRSWRRRVEMPYSDRTSLPGTHAEVRYTDIGSRSESQKITLKATDIDGTDHRNRWPRLSQASPDRYQRRAHDLFADGVRDVPGRMANDEGPRWPRPG